MPRRSKRMVCVGVVEEGWGGEVLVVEEEEGRGREDDFIHSRFGSSAGASGKYFRRIHSGVPSSGSSSSGLEIRGDCCCCRSCGSGFGFGSVRCGGGCCGGGGGTEFIVPVDIHGRFCVGDEGDEGFTFTGLSILTSSTNSSSASTASPFEFDQGCPDETIGGRDEGPAKDGEATFMS